MSMLRVCKDVRLLSGKGHLVILRELKRCDIPEKEDVETGRLREDDVTLLM
jgi:hypothetical protein